MLACEISLFEVLAKGAKLASEGRAEAGRVSLAIKSIQSDSAIRKVGAYTDDTMSTAIDLRRHHSDFVDCLILASALSECDVFVTEDAGIQKNEDLMKTALQLKPKFKVLTLKGLLGGQ